jgi:hypothetical protein
MDNVQKHNNLIRNLCSEILLFSTASRTAVGPTQPPTQLVLGGCFTEENVAEATQTTHLHLVPRLRMMVLYLRSPIRPHGMALN